MPSSTPSSLTPPPWLDAPVAPYPYQETHDLRTGPDLHPDLLGLLPLVGVWRGRGRGGYPNMEDFDYAQEVRFSHDGRPVLHYESRSWLIEADGTPIRPAAREVGWWRPVRDGDRVGDELEVMLSHPTGVMELYVGQVLASSPPKFELVTDAVVRTVTAKEVTAGQRLYGIIDGALWYAQDMAAMGQQLTTHLSARLPRVAG